MAERQSYSVKLPSLGKLYPNFPNADGSVEIYSIRVMEEKMLATGGGSISDKINKMVSSCLKTPFKIDDLLLVDRFYLMFQLSSLSYTSIRKPTVKCPNCKEWVSKEVNLATDFPVRFIDDETVEPIEVELPVSKEKILLKFLRVKDELAILSTIDRLKKPILQGSQASKAKRVGLSKDDIYTIRLVYSITQISGEEKSLEERVAWANELIGQDSEAIRNAFDDYDFGVDTTYQVKCTACDETFQAMLPSDEFFRL